jgi:NAD(P)-dependent dehydrogenase (short-subunit alcohol dehydrogenase family)
MNNAGVCALSPGLTKEGYEIQFGINHVGHALLTKLLMPTLLKTAEHPGSDVRIITMASRGHTVAPPAGIIFNDLKTAQETIGSNGSWLRYGQSKLANIHYAAELAAHYPQITSVSIDPGTIKDTNIWNAVEYGTIFHKIIMETYFWFIGMSSLTLSSCQDHLQ